MPTTLDAPPEAYPDFATRQPIETLEDGQDYSSTNVHSLLYDVGEAELIARYYRDGADALYQYPNFPASEWQGLADAASKGGYINREVVGVYSFTRLRISEWPGGARSIEHPVARRFVAQGLTTGERADHPHVGGDA